MDQIAQAFEFDASLAAPRQARELSDATYWRIHDSLDEGYLPNWKFIREQRDTITRYLTSVIATALTVPRGRTFTLVNVHTAGRRADDTAIHKVAVAWRTPTNFVLQWTVEFKNKTKEAA